MRQLQMLTVHPDNDLSAFGRTEVKTVRVRSILTPTSGFMSGYDYTLNPYSGCGFGCDYCYAKFFAPTEQGRREWGRWVSVKSNAVALVLEAYQSRELRSGDNVYMSSVTDPYQPIEGKLRLTRGILEAILQAGVQPRLTIQTRSPLVTRDIDLFKQFDRLRVNVTVTTDSEEMRLRYEPHCPSIKVRLKTLRRLADAGIRIGVSISPMLPVRDLKGFGERLAELEAEEYVTQFLKPGCSRFAAGTDVQAARKAREDGWNISEYRKARAALAEVLGSGRPLLEGTEGYAPA